MSDEQEFSKIEKSLFDLLIAHLLDKNDEGERQKFGQNIIDILNDQVQGLMFKVEQRQAQEDMNNIFNNPRGLEDTIDEEDEKEFSDFSPEIDD